MITGTSNYDEVPEVRCQYAAAIAKLTSPNSMIANYQKSSVTFAGLRVLTRTARTIAARAVAMIDKYRLEHLRRESGEKGELARWVIQLQKDLDDARRKEAEIERLKGQVIHVVLPMMVPPAVIQDMKARRVEHALCLKCNEGARGLLRLCLQCAITGCSR
jgi:hypothetical protein